MVGKDFLNFAMLYKDKLEITPDEDSLNLSCPVYVLVQDIYSSTGSLLAIANRCDQLISVGIQNSESLGKGITPLQIALPNSKLIFSVEPTVDISDCETAADTFHGNVEVPVEIAPDAFFDYWNSSSEDYFDWLLHEDPFMKKALELMKTEQAD